MVVWHATPRPGPAPLRVIEPGGKDADAIADAEEGAHATPNIYIYIYI
jgi:hypothetical protein